MDTLEVNEAWLFCSLDDGRIYFNDEGGEEGENNGYMLTIPLKLIIIVCLKFWSAPLAPRSEMIC